MLITSKQIAVAAIVATGLASGPAFAAKGNISNNVVIGKSSPAAPAAIPLPKQLYRPDAIEGSIRENARDLEEMRGLGRLKDALVNGELDSSMGALDPLAQGDATADGQKIGRNSVPGPSVNRSENWRQGDSSFTGTDRRPQAPGSRNGDLTRGRPGGATDAVPDGSGQASGTENTNTGTTTTKNDDGTITTVTTTTDTGHDDEADNVTATETTTTNPVTGESDTSGTATFGDGSTIEYRALTYANGAGGSLMRTRSGTFELVTRDKRGRETVAYFDPSDSQPTEGGSGWVGGGCGWNPLNGCTKGAVTEASILGKLSQPGPQDEVGNTSTGSTTPNVGPAAVTNSDETHLSGYSGGGRPYDPQDDFGGEGGGVPSPTN